MVRSFGWNEFFFIVTAMQWTLALSAIAFTTGAVGGLLITLARVATNPFLRFPALAFIRLFQGTPLLMQLFLVYFGMTTFGLRVDPWTAAAIGLALHASAYLGDIWRGCIEAVPAGQSEASWALGLTYADRMRIVILPQAARIAVAPTVGFLVQLIKGTSLASIIGFVELVRAGQIMSNATFQPFIVYSVVGACFFLICWPLSLLAQRLERHFSQSTAR